MHEKDKRNRRAFLGDLGRIILVGGLGAAVAHLAGRGDGCGLAGGCHGCPSLAQCELPRAASARSEGVKSLGG